MGIILVADDDADIRDVVAFKLGTVGHTVVLAQDGSEALGIALERELNLAILDVRMPGLTGVEVCRRLRREPTTARLPVILLTAQTEENDVEAGFQAGADDYIAKPFSPREVGSRVEAVLSRSRS
ncbi:response regulator transcription factor [Streptomyces sp. NPDC002580]|uniref:response regulator transcription factor n=1 Tax=Streptomyces sp. NPDC002580 TaxID=3364653 RepID=UPI0036D0D2CC